MCSSSLVFWCRPEPFLCCSSQGLLPVQHELHTCDVGLEPSSSLSNVEEEARDTCEAIRLQSPFSFSCFYSEYFTALSFIPNLTALKKKKWRAFIKSFQSIPFSFCGNNSSLFAYTFFHWYPFCWYSPLMSSWMQALSQTIIITAHDGPKQVWARTQLTLVKHAPQWARTEESTLCHRDQVSMFHQETKGCWLN